MTISALKFWAMGELLRSPKGRVRCPRMVDHMVKVGLLDSVDDMTDYSQQEDVR